MSIQNHGLTLDLNDDELELVSGGKNADRAMLGEQNSGMCGVRAIGYETADGEPYVQYTSARG